MQYWPTLEDHNLETTMAKSGKKAKKSKVRRGRDYAVRMGRIGGKIGAARRQAALSPERRKEIAQKAAAARWGTKTEAETTSTTAS